MSPGSATVAPGANASITITAQAVPASATAGTAITDTLLVTSNDPAHASVSIPIKITPTGATVTLTPPGAAFGVVPLGSSGASVTIAVANTGNQTANVTFGAPTNSQFSSAQTSLSVPVGGTGDLIIGFTPTSTSPASGTMAVALTNTAVCGTNPTSIPLSGQSVLSGATVSATSVSFGLAPCGGAPPATQTINVSNVGSASLNVTSATFGTSAFSVTSPTTFPVPIAGGAQATLTLAAAANPVDGHRGERDDRHAHDQDRRIRPIRRSRSPSR